MPLKDPAQSRVSIYIQARSRTEHGVIDADADAAPTSLSRAEYCYVCVSIMLRLVLSALLMLTLNLEHSLVPVT